MYHNKKKMISFISEKYIHIYRKKFSFINTNKSFNKNKQLEIKYWNHPPIISFYSFPTANK